MESSTEGKEGRNGRVSVEDRPLRCAGPPSGTRETAQFDSGWAFRTHAVS